MLYEGAKAELVGAPNAGLAAMFVMMNAARLQVGVQGVAIAERAYQQALAYALERQQGRSAWTGDLSVAALRPSGRAPHADADEGEDRGGARPSAFPPPSPPTSPARRPTRSTATPPTCARSC